MICCYCNETLDLEKAVVLPSGVKIYLDPKSTFSLWGERFCSCDCLADWIRTIPELLAGLKPSELSRAERANRRLTKSTMKFR